MEENKEIDWRDQYIKTLADFDNYRKHSEKRIEESKKRGKIELIKKLLPIVDSIFLAEENEDVSDGSRLIFGNLISLLTEEGLCKFGHIGDIFSDAKYNAVGTSNNSLVEESCVSKIIRYGYTVDGEIIRHADVIVEKTGFDKYSNKKSYI